MIVRILSPSGKLIDNVKVAEDATVAALKQEIQHSKAKLRTTRQRIKFNDNLLSADDEKLAKYGLKDGSDVTLKDLGPQISWRTVFLLEYAGPLVIHQVFYALHKHPLSFTQLMAFACITFHFLKREYETLFIHRFSHATMPLQNLFKNCFHYWAVSGLAIAYELYNHPPAYHSDLKVLAFSALFLAAEMGNLYTHVILRRLRSHDPKARGIPHGFGFDLVSCPNYLFESLAWLAFAFLTRLWSSWIFLALATGQMYVWALKKHRLYRRQFPEYPRSRTAMFPFLP